MSRKNPLRVSVAATIFVLMLLGVVFRETLVGLCQLKIGGWSVDKYVLKNVSDLKAEFKSSGTELLPCNADSFYSATGRNLKENQQVLRFRHGVPYPWFRRGTASNLGYIVTENSSQGETVVEIIRFVQVDSL